MDGDEEIPAEHQTDEVSFFANFIFKNYIYC